MTPNAIKECEKCNEETVHELKDGCLKCNEDLTIKPLNLKQYRSIEQLYLDIETQEIIFGSALVEIDAGYTIDPVFGRINIKKALVDRAKAIEDEYEAFDRMHTADGTFTKCPRKL